MRLVRGLVISALAALALGTTAAGAGAEGVTRIQQVNGSVETYQHVRMELRGQTLRLHSHDHKGVLEVTMSACAYRFGLKRCLPYVTVLHQHGVSHTIALDHGAVYMNLTDERKRLSHSFRELAPHEVLVSLHTARGTYISVDGMLDTVK